MPMRRVEKKPGLNKKQRRARLRFCRKYQAWTEADWLRQAFKKTTNVTFSVEGGGGDQKGCNRCFLKSSFRVLYSDESTFRQLPNEPEGHWVRYRRRDRMDRYKVFFTIVWSSNRCTFLSHTNFSCNILLDEFELISLSFTWMQIGFWAKQWCLTTFFSWSTQASAWGSRRECVCGEPFLAPPEPQTSTSCQGF